MTLEWGTSQTLELWKWCLNNRGDEQTVKKKFTGTPIIVYGAGCKTALKAAIRWQGSLERSPPVFKTFILSNCLTLCSALRSSRADSSSAVETVTICCVTFIAQDRRSHFSDSQCGKQRPSFLLNLRLKGNKRRKSSHRGSVLEISALSPPRSCLYQLHSIWGKHNEEGKWQHTLLCWWEAVRDEGRGRRVLESSKQIKMEMLPLLLNTPVSKLPAGVWGARRGRRGREEEGGGRREEEEEEERSREGGRCPSCVWQVSGLSCVVWCSEKEGEGEGAPPTHTHTHTHTHRGAGWWSSSEEPVWSWCPG